MPETDGYEAEAREGGVELRESLILAGIQELEEHGLRDFSLRRVAAAVGVSCAAPYKHFKSKEDLILSIQQYINEKWALLEAHICTVFPSKDKECLLELCLAGIRFWIGNPHFHSVHMMENATGAVGKSGIGKQAEALLSRLAKEKCLSKEQATGLLYAVRSLVLGAIFMLDDGTLPNTPETFRMVKEQLAHVIP